MPQRTAHPTQRTPKSLAGQTVRVNGKGWVRVFNHLEPQDEEMDWLVHGIVIEQQSKQRMACLGHER